MPSTKTLQHPHSYFINSQAQKPIYKTSAKNMDKVKEPHDLSKEWHNDGRYSIRPRVDSNARPARLTRRHVSATFERCPSDYSFLLMEETPPHGGDTLWCSGYEL